MYFIPEYLREDENFLVFFSFLVHEFNITEENIMKFTDLVNPDKVPMEFIEALGSYFNYHYLSNATDDFNREVLTRMRTVWEQRGTEKSILMAAVHGDNDGWVGGDIFIPGYDISNESAELLTPSKWIFTHNLSRFSGQHKFPGAGLYTPGILYLRLPYLDEQIRKRVYENTPAGLKYVFEILFNFTPNKNLPDEYKDAYGNLSLYNFLRIWPKDSEERKKFENDIDVLLDIAMHIDNDWMKYAQVFSKTRGYFSGWRNYYNFPVLENDVETFLGVSMLGLPLLKTPFPIKNGTITVKDASSLAFHHNVSEFGSGKFLSSGMVVDKQIADDSKYIIAKSGEYLDIFDKSTADHILHRSIDISIGNFYIYDEDPSLGDVNFSWQKERHVLSDDSTYDIPYIGNLTADDYVLRDAFWNPDMDILEEIIKRSGSRVTEIVPNKNADKYDRGTYGELSLYNIFKTYSLFDGDTGLGYSRVNYISSNKDNKELVHSGNLSYGKWSGSNTYLSMFNGLRTWNKEGIESNNNDVDIENETSIVVRNDLNHPLIFSGENAFGRHSGSFVGISFYEPSVQLDIEYERDYFYPNSTASEDYGTYGTLSMYNFMSTVDSIEVDAFEDRITELVVPEGRNNKAIFGSYTVGIGRHSGMLIKDDKYSYPYIQVEGERNKELSEFVDGALSFYSSISPVDGFDILDEDTSLGEVDIEVGNTFEEPVIEIIHEVIYRDADMKVHFESDDIKKYSTGDGYGKHSGRLVNDDSKNYISIEELLKTDWDGVVDMKSRMESDEIFTYSKGYGYGRRSGRDIDFENKNTIITIEEESV